MIEQKHDQVRQLINLGKERGYLLYDEVNDMLEVRSSEEMDDLLATFERHGIDIYEDVSTATGAHGAAGAARITDTEPKEEVIAEEVELDLTPGALEKINDPVRIYLREMGTVPLLNREGEVAIAKRIEHGQLLVLKTISRSLIVLKEMLAIGEELRKDIRSIKEIVQFYDEELTEERIENRQRLGTLSKQGNPLLRFLWCEAVTHAVQQDPELKRFYRRKLVQKGLGKAKVAAARKLGIRLYIMLRDQIDYKEFCRRGQLQQRGGARAGMPGQS